MPLCVRELLYAFAVRARQKLSCLLGFKSRRKFSCTYDTAISCDLSFCLEFQARLRIAVLSSDPGIRLDCVQRQEEVSVATSALSINVP
jgi:hypothetical protein